MFETTGVPFPTVTPWTGVVLEPMVDAVSWTWYVPPIAPAGTLRVAAVPQDFVTVAGGATVGTATPSSVAFAGPVTCHWQLAGLPALVLVSAIFPLPGFPENVTTVVPVGGVKLAVIGASVTTTLRCAVSVSTPSST